MKNLNEKEKAVVLECLKATADGPFFDDDDFHILFGLDRNEIRKIIADFQNINDSDTLAMGVINDSINNLIGFPHNKWEIWDNYISISPDELERLFKKWKAK